MADPPPPPPPGLRIRHEPAHPLGTCATCRFYAPPPPTTTDDPGECRRHAPGATTPGTLGEWPRTPPDGWCGKWEPPHPHDQPRP